MGDKKGYKVTSPVLHNGRRYEEGASIELLPEEADALIKAKAITAADGSELSDSIITLRAMVDERDKIIADLRLDLETAQKALAELTAAIAEEPPKQPQKAKGKK